MIRRLALPLVLAVAPACGGDGTPPTEPPPPAEVPAAATEWLRPRALPFDGTSLTLPHADLGWLRDVVGDARVVSLGENTHGTRDFFEMKARVLRFLVEEMDFDAFAIEATWPESNRLDRYVRTGQGDAAALLSGLYFWTWRTESVLEMIEWMRSHNAAGGEVGFYGFDMQFPGMALWNVRKYVDEVDPTRAETLAANLQCLQAFANDHRGIFPSGRFADQTTSYKSECMNTLDAAEADFLAREAAYVTASSEDDFALAARSLRVALQFAEMGVGRRSRDQSMAANALWLADRFGPNGKIVLWAHNFHVSELPQAMGFDLRRALGDDMVVVGFTHTSGAFTAVTQAGSSFRGLDEHLLDARRDFSYEHYFSSVGMPRFAVDLRSLGVGAGDGAWLAGPRETRSIGCCYEPGNPGRYWFATALPTLYDVIVHVERTRPTRVVPFVATDGFEGH